MAVKGLAGASFLVSDVVQRAVLLHTRAWSHRHRLPSVAEGLVDLQGPERRDNTTNSEILDEGWEYETSL